MQPKLKTDSFPSIPVELYQPIVEEIDTQCDLYTLLFVSKAFHAESERVLYREIHVQQKTLGPRLQLLKHLSNSPHLAHHIRSLSIWGMINDETYTWGDADEYFRAINGALCALPFLKDLTLANQQDPVFQKRYPTSSLLSGCRFQLRTLTIFTLYPFDRTELENQKYIEELQVSGANPDSLPQVTSPRLSVLSVTATLPQLAPEFIRGIKALRTDAHCLETIVANQSPFANMLSLSLTLWDPSLVAEIPLLFPSTRYIRLYLHNFSWTTVKLAMEQFQRLPTLQKVHFDGIHHGRVPKQSLVLSWFSKIVTLQSVVIQISLLQHMEWVRGAEHAVAVEVGEEWKDTRWIA